MSRDYAELEKRLTTVAHNMCVTRAEDIKPAPGESLPALLREAADALVSCVEREAKLEDALEACRDWLAACPSTAGPEDGRSEWMTAGEMLGFVRVALKGGSVDRE